MAHAPNPPGRKLKWTLGCYCVLMGWVLWTTPSGLGQEEQRSSLDPGLLSQLCIVRSAEINENSGIAVSPRYDEALWTHNDSGGKPKAFLISQTSGKTLATVQLQGATNVDWEDISSYQEESANWVMLADVGDNGLRRKQYQLYVFEEPDLDELNHQKPKPDNLQLDQFRTIQFRYEDGSHNCEAVTVDIENKQVFLLEKVYRRNKQVPGVYVLDLNEADDSNVLVATRIADIPIKNITAMGLSPDGNQMIVRSYVNAFLYRREKDQTWSNVFQNPDPVRMAMPLQRQGEGICFSRDGQSVICSSEFKKAPLWQIKLKESK